MNPYRGTISHEKRRSTTAKRGRDKDDEDEIQITEVPKIRSSSTRGRYVKQEPIASPTSANAQETATAPSPLFVRDTPTATTEALEPELAVVDLELPTSRVTILKDEGDVIVETIFTTPLNVSHTSSFKCSFVALRNLGGRLANCLQNLGGVYTAALEYHGQALEAILRVAHLQFDKIPPPEDDIALHQYIEVAQTLEVWSTMEPWLRHWTYAMFQRCDPDESWLEWLYISWHMKYPHTFERQVQRCILSSCLGGQDTTVIQRDGVQLMRTHTALRAICEFEGDEIRRLRHELLNAVLTYLHSVIDDPKMPRCKAKVKDEECSGLQSDRLFRCMQTLRLMPKPDIGAIQSKPVDIWHGIMSIEPPKMGGKDHEDCDLSDVKTELSRRISTWVVSPFRATGRATDELKTKFDEHFEDASFEEYLRSVPHLMPSIETSRSNKKGIMASVDDFEDGDWDPDDHSVKTYAFDIDKEDLEEMMDDVKHLGPTIGIRMRSEADEVIIVEDE